MDGRRCYGPICSLIRSRRSSTGLGLYFSAIRSCDQRQSRDCLRDRCGLFTKRPSLWPSSRMSVKAVFYCRISCRSFLRYSNILWYLTCRNTCHNGSSAFVPLSPVRLSYPVLSSLHCSLNQLTFGYRYAAIFNVVPLPGFGYHPLCRRVLPD